MKIRAALLDENGVFLRMDEVEEGNLTDRHLPEVSACDLPAGLYRWTPSAGAFVPLRFIEEQQNNAAAALRLIERKRERLDEQEKGIRKREGM